MGREELDGASVGQRLRGHRGEVRLEAQRGALLDALPAHNDCSTKTKRTHAFRAIGPLMQARRARKQSPLVHMRQALEQCVHIAVQPLMHIEQRTQRAVQPLMLHRTQTTRTVAVQSRSSAIQPISERLAHEADQPLMCLCLYSVCTLHRSLRGCSNSALSEQEAASAFSRFALP